MADLDAALDELRTYADRPPYEPRSLDDVEAAVRRNRRHRRGTGAGLAAAVIALVVVVALVIPTDGEEVEIVDEPNTTTSTTEWQIPPGITIEPSRGLEDGDVVRVTGSFSPSSVQGVALCADEGRQEVDRLRWCDLGMERRVVDGVLEVTVVRRIVTAEGVFDCAERPGRCLLGVRDNQGVDRSAPISFRDDLGSLAPHGISIGRTDLSDGELVEIIGSGWSPESIVEVRQCVGVPPSSTDEIYQSGRCDLARPLQIAADEDGWFRTGYLAYEQIHTSQGWVPCNPCTLVAFSGTFPPYSRSITVSTLGNEPILPTIELAPAGPYTPGQVVRADGSGYQVAHLGTQAGASLGWCVAPADHPQQLHVFGDHDQGPCGIFVEDVVVAADGTFRLDSVPMPDPALHPPGSPGVCRPGSGSICATGLYVGSSFAPALAPFELVR